MDSPTPFMNLFPDIYPNRRTVQSWEGGLLGVMIKSVMFDTREEALLCRGLILHASDVKRVYTTVCFKVANLAPVVGYDLDLIHDQGEDDTVEKWGRVRELWSMHFVQEPADVSVVHDDVKRKVNARVFPLRSIALAKRYVANVKGALTFGDFCADTGYYAARDGNTPALCSGIMFGRMYFLPQQKCNGTLSPCDLVYDHERSEAEAMLFDTKHAPYFYKAACLDIETVVDDSYRDPSLKCDYFARTFPYCTEHTVTCMTEYRNKLVNRLRECRKESGGGGGTRVTVPALSGDMPGQEHEITCVSLVILNSHLPKPDLGRHRKDLIVIYNSLKVKDNLPPELDRELAEGSGVADASRIAFYPRSSELRLLEKTVELLHRHEVELLYVYNAEFDVRVIQQRVHFYADSNYAKGADASVKKRCSALLTAWNGLFVTRSLSDTVLPYFQFESVRYLEMYKEMITSVGSLLNRGELTEGKLRLAASNVEKFNKEKAKLGHFKMNGCGMVVIDLYRMAETRWIKFACTSMKLNDVAPFAISRDRELRGLPPKDPRKLRKLADVAYSKMDKMIHRGGKSLFAVLLYNLVDSQLCARLAKALRPVSALFHRCRITLNIDVVVHGRGDTFGGFVQSIHSVQMPQLKYMLDNLRAKGGPGCKDLSSRVRWDPRAELEKGEDEKWKGGSVCEPLTGLHYAGPGMGLELSFDFAGMYPSIMCALNISPETTVPWPPSRFAHDLTGWVCYCWEAEGFEYASLILRFDPDRREFAREPAVFASSVEHYLNKRAEFKGKLKSPALREADRVYYKMQEGECKVMANSFYGTAPLPCGPLISAHGRRQISLVNQCVSSFYRHGCPVMYGDTNSVMVSAGYGPREPAENGVADTERVPLCDGEFWDAENERLEAFARAARAAIADKFKRASEGVSDFLACVHRVLVEDTLERMYVIDRGNAPVRAIRDPRGRVTEEGFPVYLARAPGCETLCDITRPFVKDRRVKLEYENSSSVYCHVAKKSYVSLTHSLDENGDLASASVKIRGLSAVKSMRSPCDSAVTDAFIACVMRGDCVKLQPGSISCFSTCPWRLLVAGDSILYPRSELELDERGRWTRLDQAASLLEPHTVRRVVEVHLGGGLSAVSVALEKSREHSGRLHPELSARGGGLVVARTLYKDGEYCMNHMFSGKEGLVRDLLTRRASELIASKMGAGFFPWSSLIKSAKNKRFAQQTLARLKAGKASVKTTYVEIARTWLQRITGLSTKPVECKEFWKCNPCEAALYRYPLNLQATAGCTTAMFGGSLLCESKRAATPAHGDSGSSPSMRGEPETSGGGDDELIPHPYQPLNKCFANSRVLIAHRADRELINRAGKLVAHCVVDYCLPRHMYSPTTGRAETMEECKRQLLVFASSVRGRSKRATAAFNSIMNNCPEHMIPACCRRELESLRARRETVARLTGEKLRACSRVVVEDMRLSLREVYETLSGELRRALEKASAEGIARFHREDSGSSACLDASLSVSLPVSMLSDAGLTCTTGLLSFSRNDASERTLVDLAGALYQTVLVLQIRAPQTFPSAPFSYPDSTLCIMPYSREDPDLMRTWLDAFKGMSWLKPGDVRPGKRKGPASGNGDRETVTYHCVGCKNFYGELFANNVSGSTLISSVYGKGKERLLGYCVNETWWLS